MNEMLKALIKKQFLELASMYFRDKKTKKLKFGKPAVGFIILYALLFILIGSSFGAMALPFSAILLNTDFAWLYYALFAILAVLLSVLLDSLSTFSMLYIAKDNELLLSMPIPPSKILLSRMTVVYTMGILYELMIMLPALIVAWITNPVTVGNVLIPLLMVFFLSLFIMGVTCLLGGIIAKISVKLKNKSIITVLVTILFLLGFYYCEFKFNDLMRLIEENPEGFSETIRKYLHFFVLTGEAFTGKQSSLLLFSFICVIAFVLVVLLLSKTFTKIVITNQSTKKTASEEKGLHIRNMQKALLWKEFRKFFSSSTYMLNSWVGSVFLIIGCIAAVINKETLLTSFSMITEQIPQLGVLLSFLPTAAVCLVVSMNTISAPSVSLEGKNLWLLKSLPVDIPSIFNAKLALHFIMNFIPGLIGVICFGYATNMRITNILLSVVLIAVFVAFNALTGLLSNLKHVNLDWTNEAIPIKQSGSVALALAFGWGSTLIFAALRYLTGTILPLWCFILLLTVITAAADGVLYHKLKTNGVILFNEL